MAAEVPAKRPRSAGDGGDLKRVAEIVMVLSAMGVMRAGGRPSGVEKSLVAEAREKLAKICEDVKPKDLFSREAVRVLVEDLGLNRSRDPMMGFRPVKMSISEKLQLTKRKMEESKETKEVAQHSSGYSSQFQTVVFGANPEANNALHHGAPRFLPDKPSPLSMPTGSVQAASSVVPVPKLTSTTTPLKLSQVATTQPAVTSVKSSVTSLERAPPMVAVPRPEVIHFRLDPRSNGPTFVTHVRANTDYIPEKTPTTSAHHMPVSAMKLNQVDKLQDANSVKPEGTQEIVTGQPSGVIPDQESKSSIAQAVPGNLFMGNQAAGLTYVHPPSGFPNHNDIAQNVQKVLQQNASGLSDCTPPSVDYMSKPLNCQICKTAITDIDNLLVCDSCEKGNHLKCLQSYGNKGVSKLEWHCPRCLNSSNGKPLPPKYGRVTRTLGGSKAPPSTGLSRAPAEIKAENSESKMNHQMPNSNSVIVYSSTAGRSPGELVPGLRTVNITEIQDMSSFTGAKIEDWTCKGITSDHSKEVAPLVVAGHENSGSSPQEMQKATSALELKNKDNDSSNVQQEISKSNDVELPSSTTESTSQSQVIGDSQADNKVDVPASAEGSIDHLQEVGKPNTEESQNPPEVSEIISKKEG